MIYDVITINLRGAYVLNLPFFYIFCNQGQFFQSSKKIKKNNRRERPFDHPLYI